MKMPPSEACFGVLKSQGARRDGQCGGAAVACAVALAVTLIVQERHLQPPPEPALLGDEAVVASCVETASVNLQERQAVRVDDFVLSFFFQPKIGRPPADLVGSHVPLILI